MDKTRIRVMGAAIKPSDRLDIWFHTGNLDHIGLLYYCALHAYMCFISLCQDKFIYHINDKTCGLTHRSIGQVVFPICLNSFIYLLFLRHHFVNIYSTCIRPLSLYLSITLFTAISTFFVTRKMIDYSFDVRVWSHHSCCYQTWSYHRVLHGF